MKKLISIIMMMVSLAVVNATEKNVDLDKFREGLIEERKEAKANMEKLYKEFDEIKTLEKLCVKIGDELYFKITEENLEIIKPFRSDADKNIGRYLTFPAAPVEKYISMMGAIMIMLEEIDKKADKFIDNPTMETYNDYIECNNKAMSIVDSYNKLLKK